MLHSNQYPNQLNDTTKNAQIKINNRTNVCLTFQPYGKCAESACVADCIKAVILWLIFCSSSLNSQAHLDRNVMRRDKVHWF